MLIKSVFGVSELVVKLLVKATVSQKIIVKVITCAWNEYSSCSICLICRILI